MDKIGFEMTMESKEILLGEDRFSSLLFSSRALKECASVDDATTIRVGFARASAGFHSARSRPSIRGFIPGSAENAET